MKDNHADAAAAFLARIGQLSIPARPSVLGHGCILFARARDWDNAKLFYDAVLDGGSHLTPTQLDEYLAALVESGSAANALEAQRFDGASLLRLDIISPSLGC